MNELQEVKTEITRFLFTVTGGEAITLYNGDQAISYLPRDQFPDYADAVSPVSNNMACVLFRPFTGGFAHWPVQPNFVIQKGAERLAIFALDKPLPVADADPIAKRLGMIDAAEEFPLPGANWKVVHADVAIRATSESLNGCFFLDAITLGDLANLNDRKMKVAIIPNAKATRINSQDMLAMDFIANMCRHINGPKDGLAIVPVDAVTGPRQANAVKAVYVLGLDIDTGVLTEKVDAIIAASGLAAIRHTTHSHFATSSSIKRDAIAKFIAKDAPHLKVDSTEALRLYVTREKQWVPEIVETIVFVGKDHNEKGIVSVGEHAPMHRNRILFLLDKPFLVENEGSTQFEALRKWARIVRNVAESLGLPFDPSCVDVSRLYYTPRHKPGMPYSTSVFGGRLLDHREYSEESVYAKVAAAAQGDGQKKVCTESGKRMVKWLKSHGHRIQLADLIEDTCQEKVRGGSNAGINCECPFDEGHSDAGKPDDTGFWVANAGDGNGELFVATCRHASCQKYTGCDFVGKMLDDDWFTRDYLISDDFNALEDNEERGASPFDGEIADSANKNVERDNVIPFPSRRTNLTPLMEEASSLNANSSSAEVNAVLKKIVACKDGVERAMAERKIKSVTGMTKPEIRKAIKDLDVFSESIDLEESVEPSGRATFKYHGLYNADDAMEAVYRALDRANLSGEGEPVPMFTCDFGTLNVMKAAGSEIRFVGCSPDEFQALLANRLMFQCITDRGVSVREFVDRDVAKAAFYNAYERLPQTPQIASTPFFNADGKLIAAPGWHRSGVPNDVAATNVFLRPDCLRTPEVPNAPTQEEMMDALHLIREDLLADFPFCDVADGKETREPSEANAIGMLITPFVREMITGPTPMMHIVKPQPQSGGTLLANIPILLLNGEPIESLHYSENPEEMQKILVSAVRDGRSVMLFDNVTSLTSRPLVMSLTMNVVGGRVLGRSEIVSRPNKYLWTSTGNNVRLSGEMARRVCVMRLNTNLPEREQRIFRHEKLDEWVIENRAKLVGALLTIVQGWIAAGRPSSPTAPLASFVGWSEVVGGILAHAGIGGFLSNPILPTADLDHADNRTLLNYWFERFGHSPTPEGDIFEAVVGADLAVVEGRDPAQRKVNFRHKLAQMIGQTYDLTTKSGAKARIKIDRTEDAAGYMYALAKAENIK